LKINNEHNLYGVVAEKFAEEFNLTANDEPQRKLDYYPKNFKPMVGVSVEARRKTDNGIFRTITDNNGRFMFKDLDDGEYQVYPLLPDVYKLIGFNSETKEPHGKVTQYVPQLEPVGQTREKFLNWKHSAI
jgi:hypothetical protein